MECIECSGKGHIDCTDEDLQSGAQLLNSFKYMDCPRSDCGECTSDDLPMCSRCVGSGEEPKTYKDNYGIGIIVHVEFKKPEFSDNYSDHYDKSSIGFVWQEDATHIWIKPFKRNICSESFIGSPVRYRKELLIIKEIDTKDGK